MGTYGSTAAIELTLGRLKEIMASKGVSRLYIKHLSPNDNSKNQPYFGDGRLSALNLFPTGEVTVEQTRSRKPGGIGKSRLKAFMPFSWVGPDGHIHPAPNAKLIMYPQYAGGAGETRFSGFLQGSTVDMSGWMDPARKGRSEGRILVLGVSGSGEVIGYLAVPGAVIAKQLDRNRDFPAKGVFLQAEIGTAATPSNKEKLLEELARIHRRGWITGKRLDSGGIELACSSPNCGGYTLEAELGVTPNGYAEPDYLGWEVKQFGVQSFERTESKVITLMTPEPTGGVYKGDGVEIFLRRFGYDDKRGRPDRINFGGVHRCGTVHQTTDLLLDLESFDKENGKIEDPNGGVVLLTREGEVAAKWHYAGLIEHWKRKHSQAVYVPSLNRNIEKENQYCYSNSVKLGEGTDYLNLLHAIAAGDIYYDPGIKMEQASAATPKIKRRSQFRIKSGNLLSLYDDFSEVSLA